MRRLFRFRCDMTGNLPPLPDIFPEGMAPVVRTGSDGERESQPTRRCKVRLKSVRRVSVDRVSNE